MLGLPERGPQEASSLTVQSPKCKSPDAVVIEYKMQGDQSDEHAIR